MLKVLIIVVVFAAGYAYGFRDARKHDKTVVARLVERVGGSSRENFKSDIDAKYDSLDARSRADTNRNR